MKCVSGSVGNYFETGFDHSVRLVRPVVCYIFILNQMVKASYRKMLSVLDVSRLKMEHKFKKKRTLSMSNLKRDPYVEDLTKCGTT